MAVAQVNTALEAIKSRAKRTYRAPATTRIFGQQADWASFHKYLSISLNQLIFNIY
jgi:hypothetical protein